MFFDASEIEKFKKLYPHSPFLLRHNLHDHPLLELDRLVELAGRFPAQQLEYNKGKIDVDQRDPDAVPGNGLSAAETVREIENCGSWLALRNIETDTAYRRLMEDVLADILPTATELSGKTDKLEGYIFISSPKAVTPYHFDPEHNILLQIKGTKSMHVFPADDDQVVSAQLHEQFHSGGTCNLEYEEDRVEPRGKVFTFGPGEALHVPVKAPHWVQNGDGVSISFSVTWRSEETERHRRVYRLNNMLRGMGMNPPLLGVAPLRDKVKNVAARAMGRVGII
ncbi:MAG: cupin-like domain-containing protein [bacterium]